MYSVFPNIIPKIERKIGELGLTNLESDLQQLIKERKRFYRTIAQTKNKEKVFFKTILIEEPGIRDRFLNEIGFLKEIRENPWHPLHKAVAELLDFSLNPDFPFLLYRFLPGKFRLCEDKFKEEEVKKITHIIKIISSSPTGIFHFTPKEPMFGPSHYEKIIQSFPENNFLRAEQREKIKTFISQNQEIINSTNSSLSHGDFSEANIILHNGGLEIIDWEHVHLRNPLYDLVDFWINRRHRPEEQAVMIGEYLKDVENKNLFRRLFQLALMEICLRDLGLYWKLKNEEKTNKIDRKIEEYEEILEKGII